MNWVKLFYGILAVIVIRRIFLILLRLDFNKTVYNHEPGPCHLVPNIDTGSEDIQTMSSGVALFTSGLRFGSATMDPEMMKRKGKVYWFDFNDPQGGATEVNLEGDLDVNTFNPHGISILEDQSSGKPIVFIVNHVDHLGLDFVEKFVWDDNRKSLIHMKSISDASFKLLNDVVATGPDSFYVTVYHYYRNLALQTLELFVALQWGQVVYYDGTSGIVAAKGLITANGINLSNDKKSVYVIQSTEENMLIYSRNKDNTLQFKQVIHLGSKSDNIDVDIDTGDLWIGAHPVGYRVFQNLADASVSAPSQVLRVRLGQPGELATIDEIYSDDGHTLWASTVASQYVNAMLVGTVNHKLLYCDIKHIRK